MFTLFCGPRKGFYKVRKFCRSWNNVPIGINSSTNKPMGLQGGRQVIWQRTPIHRISPMCLYLNRLESGNDDSSSEAHLQSSKTSRGSYLDPKLYTFVKIFEFYLVTQSL
jgi:hypothetical protein